MAAGEIVEGTRRDLLRNEVVLIAPKDSALDLENFADLARAEIKRVAFAPEDSHKPVVYPAAIIE